VVTIHLVEGPVGAGKSTFAAQLSWTHSAPFLNLDEWMATLFSADRPDTDFLQWYAARKYRCMQQIWNVTCNLIDTGTSAVLELGLLQSLDRENFYNWVDAAGYDLRVYLLDAPVDARRQRVLARNERRSDTFRMEVSSEMFEMANRAWQAPGDIECRDRNIQIAEPSL
jgi:predicted kinase